MRMIMSAIDRRLWLSGLEQPIRGGDVALPCGFCG